MILTIKQILKLKPLYDFGVNLIYCTYLSADVKNLLSFNFGKQGFMYENDDENETESEVANAFVEIWNTFLNTNSANFEHMALALSKDFNPIENYDRQEVETIENEPRTDQYIQQKGTTTTTTLGAYKTDTKVSTYNSAEKDTQSETRGHVTDNNDTVVTSGADTDTTIHGKELITRRNTTHGNIGVRSGQELLQQSYSVGQYNLILEILKTFVRTYCFTYWGDCE